MQTKNIVYTIELQRYEGLADMTKTLFSNCFLTQKPSSLSKPEGLTGIQFIPVPSSDMNNFAMLTFSSKSTQHGLESFTSFLAVYLYLFCHYKAELSLLNDKTNAMEIVKKKGVKAALKTKIFKKFPTSVEEHINAITTPNPCFVLEGSSSSPRRERESKQTEILQRVFPDTPLSIIAE